jgi:hypothetical protein
MAANSAVNSGVDALSTAVNAEVMCCSPHASKVKGTMLPVSVTIA